MYSRSQSSLAYVDDDSTTSNSTPAGTSFNYTPQYASTTPATPTSGTGAASMNLSGLVCNIRRTTGKEPRPLVGATTTILGDKLYVFGGRVLSRSRPKLTSDLYELDLISRHWTKIEATGDVPPPRYFHSVCTLGDNKLVCYGGMSPASYGHAPQESSSSASTVNGGGAGGQQQGQGQETHPGVVVMSDIHMFDVPSRTWSRVPAIDSPQGRYAHCATILPSSSAYFTSSGSDGAGVEGSGGAEMVVVGGQDSSNHYIEQISVFNLRSLKWTNTSPLGRSCGAYRSVVAPLVGMDVSEIGSVHVENKEEAAAHEEPIRDSRGEGCPMLIYSNYNFLDVKLELQVRLSDGQLVEKPMRGQTSPPGLRFPNGGVINGHFVVSGTYLTSSKQEYAIWSLDLKTLIWSRIDAGGSVFSQGSWNRGILWPRRSAFVILGHRRRSLVEDYNHRRINFSHVCIVELEAFGLYDNPCRMSPTSGYISHSCPLVPTSLRQRKLTQMGSGGRPFTSASVELGKLASSLPEITDMELQAVDGERIPVNSRLLSRRWGPYFNQLLRESSDNGASDTDTFRPDTSMYTGRVSSVTVRPSIDRYSSNAPTLVNNQPGSTGGSTGTGKPASSSSPQANLELPSTHTLPPMSRPRVLYLPHTYLTLRVLVHYFYTSSLPPAGSELCTPQILCSLLQLARPYQVDGLLEATVERLHQVLDGRNAAAIFNAAAMAAGGGRGTGFTSGLGGTLEALHGVHEEATESSRSGIRRADMNGSQSQSQQQQQQHGTSASVSVSSDNTEHGAASMSVGSSRAGSGSRSGSVSGSTFSSRSRTRNGNGNGNGNQQYQNRSISRDTRTRPLRIDTEISNRGLQRGLRSFDSSRSRGDEEYLTTPSSATSESTTSTSFGMSDSLELTTSNSSSNHSDHHHHHPQHQHQHHQQQQQQQQAHSRPQSSSSSSRHHQRRRDTDPHGDAEIWTGDLSSVIGLQKRGLRGLMEGRRLRERGTKPSSTGTAATSLHRSQESGSGSGSGSTDDHREDGYGYGHGYGYGG